MHITPDLLKKYHLGHCTDEEQEAVHTWLEEDGVSAVQNHDCPVSDADIHVAQAKIWQVLKRQTAEDEIAAPRLVKRLWSRRLPYVAAAVILLAITAVSIVGRLASTPTEQPAMLSVHAQPGDKKQILLSDGTKVYLHPGATITYPDAFTSDTREIQLNGEAYFEVSPDKQKPFFIHTAYSTQIRVVGTAFNVKADQLDATVEVAVYEGVVHFMKSESKEDYVELKLGQSAIYNDHTALFSREEAVPVDIGAWRHDRLVFDEEDVESILLRIEQWYGYRIKVDDSALLCKKYSAKYENPKLEELLKSMAFVLDYNYKIDNDNKTVTIY